MTGAELIGDFLPPRVFDAHAHLYRLADLDSSVSPQIAAGPAVAGIDQWRDAQHDIFGGQAPQRGLLFAFPAANMNRADANRFVLEQTRADDNRALMMIHPNDDPGELDLDAGWSGFKVYHFFSGLADSQDATIDQFLPRWAWQIAHERGWAIMLHIVRRRSLADLVNTDCIVERCRHYNGAKLILAHAARGFCGHRTLEGIERLRGLDNVFFDTSVVCEPLPLWAILQTFGASRLLYGSDYPVSAWRGRPFTMGDGFYWVYEGDVNPAWSLGKPALTGIESIHAIKQAAHMHRLTDVDIDRIFHDNAVALLD